MKKLLVVLTLTLLICGSALAFTTSAETNIFLITVETLPVVLSSFSAVTTASGFVSLRWVTESETELLGYRVYRSDNNNLVNAQNLSTQIIPATNTSNTQSYTFTDNEVAADNTYYYWLEILEYSYSHYHGPISVNVHGTEAPELPLQTFMGNVYPNPFRFGSKVQVYVQVKDSDLANVAIYNILGQRVKNYQLQPGAHQLYWDGRDHSGKPCGSGIYLVRLSSDTMSQSAKLMLIK